MRWMILFAVLLLAGCDCESNCRRVQNQATYAKLLEMCLATPNATVYECRQAALAGAWETKCEKEGRRGE